MRVDRSASLRVRHPDVSSPGLTARPQGLVHVDRFEGPSRAQARPKPKKPKGLAGLFQNVGAGISKFFQKMGNAFFGGAAVGLSNVSNTVGTIFGLNKAPRALTAGERDLLGGVYGPALNLDKVRVVQGGPFTMAVNGEPPLPRAVGNTIYWPTTGPFASKMDKNGVKLDDAFARQIFVHEAAHTAQFQNAGPGINAFAVNVGAVLSGQNRNTAYEWERLAPATRWDQLNPEMQAHLVEDAFVAGVDDGGRLVRNGIDFTAYAQDALRQARAGQGWNS